VRWFGGGGGVAHAEGLGRRRRETVPCIGGQDAFAMPIRHDDSFRPGFPHHAAQVSAEDRNPLSSPFCMVPFGKAWASQVEPWI